jgi:hypothetical protein
VRPRLQGSASGVTQRLTCAVLLACGLAGCGATKDGSLVPSAEAFVPSDATDKVTTDRPSTQIAFKVRRPWLQFAIDERRIAQAKADGWKICSPPSAEWVGYEDASVTPPIYRRHRTYILFRDDLLIQLFGIYDNPIDSIAGGNTTEQPPVQQGVVIASKATAAEMEQTASDFHLSCNPQ